MNGLVLPVMLTLLSWLPCAVQGAEDPLQRVDAYLQRWHGVGRLNGVVLVARGDLSARAGIDPGGSRWGRSTVVDLIRANGDVTAVLGLSREDFETAWREFVAERYSPSAPPVAPQR